MAKVDKFGFLHGKFNGAIFYVRTGKQLMRKPPEKLIQPKSPAQLAVLHRFSMASKLSRVFKDVVAIGFQGYQNHMTPANAFIKHLMTQSFKNEYPDQEIDFRKVKVAIGEIQVPTLIVCERVRGVIELTWNPQKTHTHPDLRDSLLLVMLNDENEVYGEIVACRYEGQTLLKPPPNFEARVHAWAFYYNPMNSVYADFRNVSSSVYLGHI